MFSKSKEKISEKFRTMKKAAFLALVSYLYDLVAKRMRKKQGNKFVEDVEYEIKDENKKS